MRIEKSLGSGYRRLMERVAVESTAVAAVGYDQSTRTLEVEFRSGRVYQYADVPRSAYEWLLRAPSKGALMNRLIKQYEARDVTPSQDVDLRASLQRSLTALREP